jgi:hypothetical protein
MNNKTLGTLAVVVLTTPSPQPAEARVSLSRFENRQGVH